MRRALSVAAAISSMAFALSASIAAAAETETRPGASPPASAFVSASGESTQPSGSGAAAEPAPGAETVVITPSDARAGASAPAELQKAIELDVIAAGLGAKDGDVVVPIDVEAPIWKRLKFSGRVIAGAGLGSSRGLVGLGLRIGPRWYPFSSTPLVGFWVEPHVELALVASLTDTPFGLPRLGGGLGVGYSLRIGSRLRLTPGVEFHPFGGGFPNPAPLLLRCGVGTAF